MNICYQSASFLVDAMKRRELSAVSVMEAHLERIAALNPVLNGLVQAFSPEDCLERAYQADQTLSQGRLHGLPCTIKDRHLVKGLVSCLGCEGLKGKVAQEDSTLVFRLKKEGALIIGITNVPELLSSYETDNLVYGRTNNPYDLEKSPGGSSGGCAALIASGCSPLSIGSDAAGSLRWPAHCTGIAAHKPTIGLIPRTGSPMGDARGLASHFITSGPMARSVDDLILTLPILSGGDGIDPYSPPVHLKDPLHVDVSSLRIAYSNLFPIADDIAAVFLQVCEGAAHLPMLGLNRSYQLMWDTFFGDRGEGLKNMLAHMKVKTPSPLLEAFLQEAAKSDLNVTTFRDAYKERDAYRIQMLEAMQDFDILLLPVAATPAKTHGTTLAEMLDMSPCTVHSITGWPVTTVRCGTSKEGLPIGIQVAAKPWQDHLSLAYAKHLETTFGGWQPSPLFL